MYSFFCRLTYFLLLFSINISFAGIDTYDDSDVSNYKKKDEREKENNLPDGNLKSNNKSNKSNKDSLVDNLEGEADFKIPFIDSSILELENNPEKSNDSRWVVGKEKDKDDVIIKKPKIPELDAQFKNWIVLTLDGEEGFKRCYAVSYPFDKSGNHTDRRRPYLMVLIDSSMRESFFAAAGYLFCKNCPINISVDGKQHFLKANEYIGVPTTKIEDSKIIKDMLSSSKIFVYSRSIVGTYSVDIYSMDGFTDAYKRILSICLDKEKKEN